MKIQLIKMPIFQGAQFHGSELAPSILEPVFQALFKNHEVIAVREVDLAMLPGQEGSIEQVGEACRRLALIVAETLAQGALPVTIGGDHSLAWGSLGVTAKHFPDLHCVYVDAHGDFNTPQCSPSGHVHGMHLSFISAMGPTPQIEGFNYGYLPPAHLHFFATRALDPGEEALSQLHKLDVCRTTALRPLTPNEIYNSVSEKLAVLDTSHIHLSFDIDAVDPTLAPGTGVPEKDGLTVEQAAAIVKAVFDSGKTVAIDIVEYSPTLDTPDKKTLHALSNIFSHQLGQ